MGAAVDESVGGFMKVPSKELINSSTTHVNYTSTTNAEMILKEETPTQSCLPPPHHEKHQKEELENEMFDLHSGHCPKAVPPPQAIIIPAQQASTVVTNAARKVRRALSMPRNPFRWSRKFKTTNLSVATDSAFGKNHIGGGSSSALSSCVSGNRGKTGSLASSLNSYEAVGAKDFTEKHSITAKSNETEQGQNCIDINVQNEHCKRIIRRSALRKFVNRVTHQLRNSITVGGSKCNSATRAAEHPIAATTLTTTTDRVPPICGYQWPADQTPGVMGLKNHGNTCFMNAVLQCLSHTDILAEYFVLDLYKADLKRRNKINSRKFGTKGELTEQLANVLKALWTCKNESDHSTTFKAVVERYGSQFRSSTQHDAQEFLFWLLDKVHEDLNTATKRRYKLVKNNYGRPDEVIAAETLANHIRCNNSFVQAVFQAQFRSSLTCPRCKKQSNTFDPFHCISVQLPQLTQQTIYATVVYLQKQPKQVKHGIRVPAGSPIVALREQLQTDTGIPSDRMILVDLNEEGFTRVFYDSQPVATLSGLETIFCIETPSLSEHSSNSANTFSFNDGIKSIDNLYSEHTNKSIGCLTTHVTNLLLLVANVRKKKTKDKTIKNVENLNSDESASNRKGNIDDEDVGDNNDSIPNKVDFERFGPPFSLHVPRDSTYTELQKKLLREMSLILKPEVFSYSTPLKDMFRIRLQDPSADPETYIEQVEHPLLTEMIDLALSVLSSESGPPHVKILLEWVEPEHYFSDFSNTIVDHEGLARFRDNKNNDTAALTLEQCLEHYTKAETLSAEDAWRCPHCQQYLPVVKTLGLWSLPDILVVHFKRFRQHHGKGPHAAKLTTMVNFPLTAFDMSPHLARGANGDIPATSSELNKPYPWRKFKAGDSRSSTLSSRADNKETRYDLYAVCYHQGDTLETGHYTAACKNPYDRQWYKFDDQTVTKVPNESIKEQIINNEAYMLFYQRRVGDGSECSGSSSNSSDHWVSRIAPPGPGTLSKVTTIDKTLECTTDDKVDKLKEKIDLELKDGIKPIKVDEKDVLNLQDAECNADKNGPQEIVILSDKQMNSPLHINEFSYADEDETEIVPEIKAIQNEDKNVTVLLETDEEQIDKQETNQVKISEEVDTQIFYNKIIIKAEINELNAKRAINVDTTKVRSVVSNSPSDIKGCAVKSPNSQGTSSPANTSISSSTSSINSTSSPHSLVVSTVGASNLQNKFNNFITPSVNKEITYSTSLNSNSKALVSTSFVATRSHEFQLIRNTQSNWQGSRSSVSAVENSNTQSNFHSNSLSLRHSFSTSSNYKFRDCNDTLSSLLRNSTNTCSKDTLLFIDQQNHSLIEDDTDTFMGSRSLWISPVTPHKLITVSPKN